MLNILYSAILGGMIGALLGLIPFFLGRAQGKPNLALLALLCCTVGGAIIVWLAIAVAIGFVIAVLASGRDCAPLFPSKTPTMAVPLNGPIDYEFNYTQHLGIACLSGPLKGQVYSVGSGGLMIGRDYDCAVQYNANTPGISRHHCSLRWCQGQATLVDLGSSYGSFLADGRKLPPNYPVPIRVGDRFYLGTRRNTFQLINM